MGVHYRVSQNGRYQRHEGDSLAELFKTLEESGAGPAQVLIHAHGGLVPEAKGLEIARFLAEPTAFGALHAPLIFPVWRTGLEDAFPDYLRKLIQKPALRDILRKLFDWAIDHYGVAGDGSRGTGALSTGERNAFFQSLEREAPASDPAARPGIEVEIDDALLTKVAGDDDAERTLKRRVEESERVRGVAVAIEGQRDATARGGLTAEQIAAAQAFRQALSPDLDKEIEEELVARDAPGARGTIGATLLLLFSRRAMKAARACLKRWRTGRGHGLWPTVVEEMARAFLIGEAGADLWWEMKDDARRQFEPGGDGQTLLRELASLRARLKARGRTLSLALTGHSAGSIFHSHFLLALATEPALRDLPVDLVLMAPAVDLELFAQAYAAGTAGGLRSTRIYTMSDACEKEDALVGALYPRSLLYLISGVLESGEPDDLLLGMERSLTLDDAHLTPKERARRDGLKALMALDGALTYATTKEDAVEGRRSQARSHGAFDRDPPTIASVVYCLTP